MPQEYNFTYKYTDTNSHGMGSGHSTIESSDSKWKESGETTRKIGQVTRIECKRILSAGTYSTVTASCNLVFKSPSTAITSNSVTQSLSYNNYFNFEWTGSTLSSLTNAHFDNGWTLEIDATSGRNIYWQAYKERPIVMTVYFYDWNDMVGNSTPPSMSASNITINGADQGLYLRNYSDIKIVGSATTDIRYSDTLVNTYSLTLTQSGKPIYSNAITVNGNASATFNVGKISTAGTVGVALSLRDNVGRSANASKSFIVTDYSPPTISSVSGKGIVERCKQVRDEYGSSSTWVLSSDGDHVVLNLTARVSTVSGKSNSGTLYVRYGTGTTASSSSGTQYNVGSVNTTLTKTDDHTTISSTFNVNTDYWFRFTLTDSMGGNITKDVYIGKMESIFNIEPNGVAIGQLSTGTSANKKFECAYPATFSGGATFSGSTSFSGGATFGGSTKFSSGITDSKGYRMDYVGKTERLTITASGLAPYSQDRQPMLSRVGPIVFLEGALKATAAMNLQNDLTLCTLPTWAHPRVIVSHLGQGSGAFLFWIRIENTGVVTLSRYRNGSSYGSLAVGNQLVFTLCWLAADAAPALPTYSGDPAGEIPGIE